MWTADSEEEEEEEVGADERSERVVAMRDGTRKENATRLWGAIEMDVNEDKVAPWNVDVDVDAMNLDFGCAEPEPEEGACAGSWCGGGARLGMNDVTTATGCAVSRRSARIFWESPRALILLAARSKEDQRFVVASATGKRDVMRPGTQVGATSDKHLARAGITLIPSCIHPHLPLSVY